MKAISLLTLYIEKTEACCCSKHCTVELRLMCWAAIFSHVEVRSRVFHLAKILMTRVWESAPKLASENGCRSSWPVKKMIAWVLCRQWYLQGIKAPDHEFGWRLCCLGGSWVWRASPTLEGISWRLVLLSRVLTTVFASRHPSHIHTWINLGKWHWRTWHSARLCSWDGPLNYLKACEMLYRILHHVLKDIIMQFISWGAGSTAFCNQAMLRLRKLWHYHLKKLLHRIAIWAHTFDMGTWLDVGHLCMSHINQHIPGKL